MPVSVSWEDQEGTRWIHLEGDLDMEGCQKIYERFEKIVEEGDGDVILDLHGVTFMATAGIRMLIEAHQWLKPRGRQLKVSGLQPRIREVFETMNLLELFEDGRQG